MFEQEIKRYDRLAAQYLEKVVKPMGDLEFRKHSEIIFSCHSCGIEGSSFSVDDTRALFEQGLGYYPVGKTLLECQEMADHFKAYEWMHDHLDHPFDVALMKTINRLVTQGSLPYRVPDAVPGEFTTVDMVAGDTLFGDHEKLIAQVPRLMESTAKAMAEDTIHPMVLSARFHGFFEYLHPFRDGNGRTGRLLSNFILLQFGLPELIICKEDRQQYISALKAKRTEGTDEHLIAFFFQAAVKQMQDDLDQKKKGSRSMLFF
ncbi:MAG: Fic family protein [Muribaculaceae bacterium]|nr:Fic family protein [Muribaculaceae bacterium]